MQRFASDHVDLDANSDDGMDATKAVEALCTWNAGGIFSRGCDTNRP